MNNDLENKINYLIREIERTSFLLGVYGSAQFRKEREEALADLSTLLMQVEIYYEALREIADMPPYGYGEEMSSVMQGIAIQALRQ